MASWAIAAAEPGALVRAGRVTCTAAAAGRKLRLLAASLRAATPGAVAMCRWRIPGAAKGRRVRGSVAVRHGNRVARRAFAFRAR
jgi:hypothetical protein